MKKETLEKAKRLEADIQRMEFALSYYKRGRWSHWDNNDSEDSFHFEFCKNWSHRDADMQTLPKWLNEPLMEVVEREMNRCKQELEMLHDDNIDNNVEITPTEKCCEEEKAEQPIIQEENHGIIWKSCWSLVLTIIFVGASVAANMIASMLCGYKFDMQTVICCTLFSTIWLVCFGLLYKGK